jgi:hypothetical protein
MELSNPQYITDNSGKKIAVVLPVKEYEWMILELGHISHDLPIIKSRIKPSELRGKMVHVTNEQIDQQFNEMRNEW